MQNRFVQFYTAFPRKVSRKTAEKAFNRIAPDDKLLAEILTGLDRAKASGQWTDPKFTPYPASWLNAEGWRDEIQLEYSSIEESVIDMFNATLAEQLCAVDKAIYVSRRAGLIREFLTFSTTQNFLYRYFTCLRDKCELPPQVGFDSIISREIFTKAVAGQYERKNRA